MVELLNNGANPLLERGHVGETVAHMCMLWQTPAHLHILRELVEMFGEPLVNAEYTSPMFKGNVNTNYVLSIFDFESGQTLLHIAVIKRDLFMVRYLLNNAADIQARATGTFFSPSIKTLQSSDPLPGSQTALQLLDGAQSLAGVANQSDGTSQHGGPCYYGEFPLSFAISTGQLDMAQCVISPLRCPAWLPPAWLAGCLVVWLSGWLAG